MWTKRSKKRSISRLQVATPKEAILKLCINEKEILGRTKQWKMGRQRLQLKSIPVNQNIHCRSIESVHSIHQHKQPLKSNSKEDSSTLLESRLSGGTVVFCTYRYLIKANAGYNLPNRHPQHQKLDRK